MGAALLTPGFGLPNPWIIHVRADHYLNGDKPETVLRDSLSAAFGLAVDRGISSIALPAIGTGVFRFPPDLAAKITADAVRMIGGSGIALVRVCVVSQSLQAIYRQAFALKD